MDEVGKVDEDFNKKKSKKKGLIISLICLLVIAIVAILVYCFILKNNPEKTFNKAIDKIFCMEQNDNYNSIKMSTKTKVSATLQNSQYSEYIDEIGKMVLKFGIQMDAEEKKEIADLGLEYNNEQVIDARVYYNTEGLYAYLEGIFDKYIELDIDEEEKEFIEEVFDTIKSQKEKLKDSEKITEVVREELKTELKEYAEFKSEKDTITLNGKDKKVIKSTITLTEKDMYRLFSSMILNLSKNDEFIDYLKDMSKDLEVEDFEDIADELKEIAEELKNNSKYAGDSSIKVSIYTSGIKNDIKGVQIEVYIENEDATFVITILEEEKDSYSYRVTIKNSMMKIDAVKGTVIFEKEKDTKKEKVGTATITANVISLGNITITTDYSIEFDKGIDNVDVKDSVNLDNLTEEEIEKILENLQKRVLIGDIIERLTTFNDSFYTDIIPSEDDNITTLENQVKGYGYMN